MYKLRQIIKHYPRLTALVGINVAVWLMLRILLLCSPASAAALLHWSELPCGWMEMLHSPWSLFTYMWVQTSGLHLIFNMVCLWWLGIMLPQGRGWSVDRLYVCGGLCGGLLYAAVGAVAGNVLIGSSAAVTAVAVAVTMIAPKKKIMFPMIGSVNLMWLTGALLAVDVLSVTAFLPFCGRFRADVGLFSLKRNDLQFPAVRVRIRHGGDFPGIKTTPQQARMLTHPRPAQR